MIMMTFGRNIKEQVIIWVSQEENIKQVKFGSQVSSPKPDTRIYDHDWHANIKPKPDIDKNQLNF